jgi:HAD superfamily hydrolase (TIGR01509 family)
MTEPGDWMVIANRVRVPGSTKAFLWDMDGVLLDTLTLDYETVDGLLRRYLPLHPGVDRAFIQSIFAYDPEEFWRRIVAQGGTALETKPFAQLLREYEDIRRDATPPCNPGIREILEALREQGIRAAVVSNNPEADVRKMLSNAGILELFNEVVGNDRPGVRKKPAPDPYLAAALRLAVHPTNCVVVEDSLLGLEAGNAAGCYTVGVQTGSASLQDLNDCGLADSVYASFAGVEQ